MSTSLPAQPSPALELVWSQSGACQVLALLGEVDIATVPRVRQALQDAPTSGLLVLDLTAVTFLDSLGLGLLVWAQKNRPTGGTRMVISSPRILKLLHMTGLQHSFDVFADLPAAIGEQAA